MLATSSRPNIWYEEVTYDETGKTAPVASCRPILLIVNFIFMFCNELRLSTSNKENDDGDDGLR